MIPQTRARLQGPDGGVGTPASPPHTTVAEDTTRLQNRQHPEPSESPAVRKSDNQGFKEATLIRPGRRGGDTDRAVPNPGVVDKSPEGNLGSPSPDHPAQGFSTRKISPQTSGCKNQCRLGWRKKLQDSRETPLKGPQWT